MARGRPCSVCASPNRPEIEEVLTAVDFAGFAAAARRFPHISEDALSRHARAHLSNSPHGTFRGTEKTGLSASDISARLIAAADAATHAREALEAAERYVDVTKAAAAEGRMLNGLLAHAALMEELDSARTELESTRAAQHAMFAAVAHLLHTVPGARAALLGALEHQKTAASTELADDMRSIHILEVSA